MKIKFIFNDNKVEYYKFSHQRELVFYITNPFKIGFGFKYRIVKKGFPYFKRFRICIMKKRLRIFYENY